MPDETDVENKFLVTFGWDGRPSFLERQADVVVVGLLRMMSPHDVAAMVAFLLSSMGENLSGQSLGIDGNVESL